jgi:hypothetical protein
MEVKMSLTSVPQEVWNEIAETQELATKWAQEVFPLTGEFAIAQQEGKEYEALRNKGIAQKIAAAYLDVKPLLLENVAISRHILQTDQLQLRSALPEVTTVSEAVMLASLDRRLTPLQQKQLEKLLQKDVRKLKLRNSRSKQSTSA